MTHVIRVKGLQKTKLPEDDYFEQVRLKAEYQKSNPDNRHLWFRDLYESQRVEGDEYAVACEDAIAALANDKFRYTIFITGKLKPNEAAKKRMRPFKKLGYQTFFFQAFNEDSFNRMINLIDQYRKLKGEVK